MWNDYIRSSSGGLKSEWAAAKLADDGSVLVGLCPHLGDPHFLHFTDTSDLKRAIVAKRLQAGKWVVDVSRHLCILKPYHLPAVDVNEATRMLEFELPSLLPFPPEQLAYGCTELRALGTMLDVLVCLVKIDKVNGNLSFLRATGLEPCRGLLSSLAIYRGSCRQMGELAQTPAILMSTDTRRCEILTCIEGNLHHIVDLSLFSQDIPLSAQAIVGQMLHQHQGLPAPLQDKTLFVLGGPSTWVLQVQSGLAAGLVNGSSDRIRILPGPQSKRVVEGPDGLPDDDKYRHEALILAGLLDIVGHGRYPHFNLLPRDSLAAQARRIRLRSRFSTGGLAAALIVFLWLCLLGMNGRIERECRQMEADIAPIKKLAGTIEAKRRQITALRAQLASRGRITRILQDFYAFTPETISLSELEYASEERNATIRIKGQADILANAFGYTEAMHKATLLNGLQIEDAQQIPRPGGSVVEFRASCAIKDK